MKNETLRTLFFVYTYTHNQFNCNLFLSFSQHKWFVFSSRSTWNSVKNVDVLWQKNYHTRKNERKRKNHKRKMHVYIYIKSIRGFWLDSARNTQILYGHSVDVTFAGCCENYTAKSIERHFSCVVHTNFSSANAFPRLSARPLRYRSRTK